ncbi:syncoilin [Nematolebias whitei]|uniref:syncoilin n=1 Tax=Nematolebias whitei TaxID=451745 RepID=UPI00189BF6AA|nr:syncoilin [Nematolebias whitei]
MSSTGFKQLLIREERDTERTIAEPREGHENPSGLSFTGSTLQHSASMKPYLQEMDELLKGCEELTGIPFSSCSSVGNSETSTSELSCNRNKEEIRMESYGCAYSSTRYIDTRTDGIETEGETKGQSLVNHINRCTVGQRTEMPLSSAGNKLRANMLEYEDQLMGMLNMLESCMEESGMDFEPEDKGQEYVHISKIPYHVKGTTPVSFNPLELETQPVLPELCSHGGNVSDESRACSEKTSDPSGKRPEKPEEQGHLRTDQGSGLQADDTEQDPAFSEEIKSGRTFEERDADDKELPTEKERDFSTDLGSDTDELRALGSRMEDCMEEVQQLQNKRKQLLVEVLQLRGERTEEEEQTAEWINSRVVSLMNVLQREEEVRRGVRKRDVYCLREERAEEEKKLWKVNLERQGLQEDIRRLRRRLFAVARDWTYSQAALNSQRGEVELLKREEEALDSLMLQLTAESGQFRSAHQQQLLGLQAKLHTRSCGRTSSTQEELSECRRQSCSNIQQYLQEEQKALEDRYGPMLVALLKRREATAGALVKTKQHAQELRAQLRPLREEVHKLELKRACLDEKLQLIVLQRREHVGRYKVEVFHLEERSRELKTELEVQKRKNKEMEELRESLTRQLLLHRWGTK